MNVSDYKKLGIVLILTAVIVMVSGCTSNNTQTFDKEGLSLEFPGNWNEIPTPSNDQNLANKSGFNIIGVFIEGKEINNYTFIMEIGKANITNTTLTQAADNLNNNYIIEESNQAPIVNRTSLKNGYDTIIFTYNGTGASSNLTVYENTYVFSKDNKTAYYIIFGTPQTNIKENQKTIQKIMDSLTIK
jgi:hypothetical protein